MIVTIDILPKQGCQVEEWVGPVFNIDGKTANIQMDSSQTVAVRLKSTTPATATPTPVPTATPRPTYTPRPTPTQTPTAAPNRFLFSATIPVEELIKEFEEDIVRANEKYDGQMLTISGTLNGAGTIPMDSKSYGYVDRAFARISYHDYEVWRVENTVYCMVGDAILSGYAQANEYSRFGLVPVIAKDLFSKSEVGLHPSLNVPMAQIQGRIFDTRLLALDPCSIEINP
jgi:hypothetical protein